MEIMEKNKRLVSQLQRACKSLGWILMIEQEEDDLLFIILDDVRYFISRTGDRGEKLYLGIMVQFHGTRFEPPSEDEKVLMTVDSTLPESLLSSIINAHWEMRKEWALMSAIPGEMDGLDNF